MTSTKPTLTIGIPAFNEEANIGILLSRLLSQKMDNYKLNKILVISDGSTDNTVAKILSIKSSKIKLVVGNRRLGTSFRLNQIIREVSRTRDYLLLFEADTLPSGNLFIHNLFNAVPKNHRFSVISFRSQPLQGRSFFSKLMNFNLNLKNEFISANTSWPNLYLFTMGLLSPQFCKKMQFDQKYHDDSYCFRWALKSGLPLYKTDRAILYYEPVSNLHDYLLQSGKFQKAMLKEEQISQIYRLDLTWNKSFPVLVKYILANPLFFLGNIVIYFLSRIYSHFLPAYSEHWAIYKSTKLLHLEN